MSQFGRGVENTPTADERRQKQSSDRMEDVNRSTRRDVTMADLKGLPRLKAQRRG